MPAFYLVQRLEPDWDRERPRGLVCEYMGSSEFEFGAVPKARARLDDSNILATVKHDITLGDVTKPVFFLGELPTINEKIDALQQWVNDGLYGKESSYFDLIFSGVDWSGEPIREDWFRTKVWWALKDDLVWSLDEDWLNVFAEQRDLRATPFGGF